MDRIYPRLPEGLDTTLKALMILVESDPKSLDDPKCPYSDTMKDLLKRLVKAGGAGGAGGVVEKTKLFGLVESEGTNKDEADFGIVLGELEATIEEFKALEKTLDDASPADSIAYYRARFQLVERWTSIKERLFNMRAMARFQSAIMEVMGEFLDKDQILDLKNRLRRSV